LEGRELEPSVAARTTIGAAITTAASTAVAAAVTTATVTTAAVTAAASTAIATAASATVGAAAISAAAAAIATTATVSAAAAAITSTAVSATATAAVSTAAAAIVTAAAATAGSATAAASVLFIGLFDGHFLAADGCVVQGFDRLACFGVVRHIYEAEAFALPGFPVHNNFSKIHCAVQFEHFFQIHIIKIVRKTCYKKLHADRFKR
jgi:hypothetical protein